MASSSKDADLKFAATQCPLLPRNFQWLVQHCPVFPINGSKVRVITDPNEFYAELVAKASSASERISMSSLYLGTGKLEENLVSTMLDRAFTCQSLRIHWLLDFTRGSRGTHNSRTMLQPLISSHPQTCSVSLYHTPDLRGFYKWIIPQRWNEVIGLQHMKLYVFDDSLVISGANLSNDYFTNRQDRYVVFDNCPDLADFYHRLIKTVSKFSLQLQKDNSTNMLPDVQVHPFLGDYTKYCSAMKGAVEKLWHEECTKSVTRLRQLSKDAEESHANGKNDMSGTSQEPCKSSKNLLDTLVFPTVELGPFNVVNDSVITNKIFTSAENSAKIQLASGYFNLTEEYKQCVLSKSEADYNILMAHPKANGFLGARGVAGGIPAAYTLIAKNFFERIQERQNKRISLFEYQRLNWTFHGKGLWYYKPKQSLPFLTMIGSANFGRRSVNRDLESQAVIVTSNRWLQLALHQEQQHLYSSASIVTRHTFLQPDRLVPYWVRFVIPIVKLFM